MQSQDFSELLKLKPEQLLDRRFTERVKEDTDNLPEGCRTPTQEEMQAMNEYASVYRKNHPNASEREIRRAVKRKFPIKILPNT